MPAFTPTPPDALASALVDLQQGLELLGLPCCVIDQALRYRFVNAAYLAYAGRVAGELLGRELGEAALKPPTDERRRMLARALAGEDLVFDRLTVEGPDEGRWVRAHYHPIRRDGEVAGAAVVVVDLQTLKEAEAAIAARERQLALITDTIGFPVTYIDRDGILRFANAQSVAWSGMRRDDMVGRHYHELAPPPVLAQSRPLVERALAGESVTYEREALWPGREKRRIRGYMIPD